MLYFASLKCILFLTVQSALHDYHKLTTAFLLYKFLVSLMLREVHKRRRLSK